MAIIAQQLKMLVLESGQCPFEEWYVSIRDTPTRARIRARLTRIQTGNFGDHKNVGKEVNELRLDFGPGYRIYYARVGEVVVVLLGGGDKGSQEKDIEKAQQVWEEYKDAIERFQRDFPG